MMKFDISFVLLLTCLYYAMCERLILSPYIKQNRTDEALRLSKVVGLPNAPDIESYSGFFTVDDKYNSNLFFWFFPAFVSIVNIA